MSSVKHKKRARKKVNPAEAVKSHFQTLSTYICRHPHTFQKFGTMVVSACIVSFFVFLIGIPTIDRDQTYTNLSNSLTASVFDSEQAIVSIFKQTGEDILTFSNAFLYLYGTLMVRAGETVTFYAAEDVKDVSQFALAIFSISY